METSTNSSTPGFRFFSEITPELVDWLWKGWLARGKLTLFVGDPDIGKTTVGIDLAARLSLGGQWPDGTTAPTGRTLILSAEDDPSDMLAVLLERHGADLSKVAVMPAIRHGDAIAPLKVQLAAIATILETEPFELIEIQPITAFLGKASRSNDAEMRLLLTIVCDFARDHHRGVLGTMHPKGGVGGRKAIERIKGSSVFGEAGRIVMMAVDAPDDDNHNIDTLGRLKLLAVVKSNLTQRPKALLFSLPPDQPVRWLGQSVIDIDVAATRPEHAALNDERQEVLDFIHERRHPVTAKDLAFRLRKTEGATRKYLAEMAKVGLLTRPVKGFYDDAKRPMLSAEMFERVREHIVKGAKKTDGDAGSASELRPSNDLVVKRFIRQVEQRRKKGSDADTERRFPGVFAPDTP